MAAGTVVLAGERLRPHGAAGRGARASLHADLFTIANTSPTCSTSCWPAASSTPCWCRSWCARMKDDADGGEAYANRVITLAGLFLGVVTVLLVVAAPLGDAALPRPGYFEPDAERPARVDRRLRPLVPAAGLLLRHVRAGRAGPQRARPLRADDVGADRQQRHLGRGAGRLPRRLRHRRRAPRSAAGSRTGQEVLLGLGSTLGIVVQFAGAGALPARRGLHLPPALRLPRHRAGPHPAPRRVDGAVRRWSTRSPTPWWSGSPPAAPAARATAAARRPPATRSTPTPS